MLDDNMTNLVRLELANDPQGRGYAGKSNDEVAGLLNDPYQVAVTTYQDRICRTSAIFNGVASAPNALSADDVAAALAS